MTPSLRACSPSSVRPHEQHVAVLLLGARRFEGRQATREHSVRGRGLHAQRTYLCRDAQLRLHLLQRVLAQGVVERCEEVQHVDTDGGHDDTISDGLLQLGQAVAEMEVALGAQFDGVVVGVLGERPFLLERVAREQLFLAGGLDHGGAFRR